jgi:hypothetical protein
LRARELGEKERDDGKKEDEEKQHGWRLRHDDDPDGNYLCMYLVWSFKRRGFFEVKINK